MYIIALITMVWLKRIIPAYLVVYTPVSSGQCVFIIYIIALITMVWLKRIIPAYSVVCIHQFHKVSVSYHVYHCPDNYGMVEKDNTSLSSSIYTSFIRSVCLIMYIIALITMVWLKMIIPAYLVVCIHQFHQVSVSYHVYHCPDNNGMIENDNTSLFSSTCMHTPVSSGQCVLSCISLPW